VDEGEVMPISSEAFRDALRHFPAGVTIVTIKSGLEVHGLTVSAFASISPEPPLILVCIDHRHHAHDLFKEPGATFAVNILREDEQELSNRFAYVKDEDRFAAGQWTVAVTGAPVLEDALAWLDCTVFSHQRAGTHTIYVGEVQASSVPHAEEHPLVYWNRAYHSLK
jgi:flavin reductase (DIM6/NTAB) family NADH-FMN oxidoreductase RutF